MSILAAVLAWCAILLSDAPYVGSAGARGRERALDRYARTAGLALSPSVRAAVTARLVRRERVVLGVAVVFLVAGLASSRVLPGAGSVGAVLVPLAAVVARAVALAVHAVRDQLGAPDGPRVARVVQAGVDDYVAPRVRRWTRATHAVALVLAAVGGVVLAVEPWGARVTGSGAVLVAAGVLAALSVLALPVVARVQARVVDRGQPAAAPVGLAWSDALRSRALLDLVHLPAVLAAAAAGVVAIQLTAVLPPPDLRSPAGAVATSALAAVVVLAVVLVLAVSVAAPGLRTDRYYRQRLWPDVRDPAPRPASAGGAAPGPAGGAPC